MNPTPPSTAHAPSAVTSDSPASDQPTLGPRSHIDATGRIRPGARALVLGGGGSTGNAWLIGVLAGLADAGLDATRADRVLGTSAGSTAAAQLAGATPSELLTAIVGADDGSLPNSTPASTTASRPVSALLQRMRSIIDASADIAEMRRHMCRTALDRDDADEESRNKWWRTTVAARLPRHDWPGWTLLITAVDARTCTPVVFDRHSEVDLVDAVAASGSNGFAFRIGERCYIDGGYRINAENADLASGCERVLILSPFGGRSFHPQAWGTHLASQVAELRGQGSRVETIVPSEDSEHLFGANAMDASLRPEAARAGYELGRNTAPGLTAFWS